MHCIVGYGRIGLADGSQRRVLLDHARPKGTAQIWFGPLPPCALDTWHDMMVFLKSR